MVQARRTAGPFSFSDWSHLLAILVHNDDQTKERAGKMLCSSVSQAARNLHAQKKGGALLSGRDAHRILRTFVSGCEGAGIAVLRSVLVV